MVAEANTKIESVVQGIDPLKVEELVTYVNFILSKVREMALGKAQEVAVKWTEEYFSTSPILPLLKTLSKEGRVDVKVIDYETTLEAGLAGDVVATVEKLVMETLNRLLIRGGGTNAIYAPLNVDQLQKERKPNENNREEEGDDDQSKDNEQEVIGLAGKEGDPEQQVEGQDGAATTMISSELSKKGRKLDLPALEAFDREQVRMFYYSGKKPIQNIDLIILSCRWVWKSGCLPMRLRKVYWKVMKVNPRRTGVYILHYSGIFILIKNCHF